MAKKVTSDFDSSASQTVKEMEQEIIKTEAIIMNKRRTLDFKKGTILSQKQVESVLEVPDYSQKTSSP